ADCAAQLHDGGPRGLLIDPRWRACLGGYVESPWRREYDCRHAEPTHTPSIALHPAPRGRQGTGQRRKRVTSSYSSNAGRQGLKVFGDFAGVAGHWRSAIALARAAGAGLYSADRVVGFRSCPTDRLTQGCLMRPLLKVRTRLFLGGCAILVLLAAG